MSFAGVSVTVIVLATLFVVTVALSYTGFRRSLLGGIIAFFPATLIYQNFPWFSPSTAAAAIGLWAGCFLVSFWALKNRVDGAPWPRMGKFFSAIGLAIAAVAELVALYVSVLPLSAFFALPEWLILAADVSFALPVLLALSWVF